MEEFDRTAAQKALAETAPGADKDVELDIDDLHPSAFDLFPGAMDGSRG